MQLIECYVPIFRLACEFTAHPERYSQYGEFRTQAIALFEQAKEKSQQLCLSDQSSDEALFAVIVWFDERVLRSALPHVILWRAELLQTKYFATVVGGELFFNKLNQISPDNKDIRRVYLFCLLLGFQGKYHQHDSQARAELIHQERGNLPEPWREWPNEADITPYHENGARGRKPLITRVLNHRWSGVALISTQYLLLSFSLLTLF